MNTLQVGDFDPEDIDKFVVAPAPNFSNGFVEGRDTEIDSFSWGSIVEF